MSFLNESLKINSAVKEGGYPVTLTAGSSAKFEVYKPSNETVAPNRVPDLTWTATILDIDAGTFFYDVLASILDEVGSWGIQPLVIKDGATYHGDPFCYEVEALGSSC